MFWEAISNTWKSVSSDIQTLRIWFKILGCASFLLSTVRSIVRLLVVFNFVERQEWAKIHARIGNTALGERLVSGLRVVFNFDSLRDKSGQNTSLNQRNRDTRQAPKVVGASRVTCPPSLARRVSFTRPKSRNVRDWADCTTTIPEKVLQSDWQVAMVF